LLAVAFAKAGVLFPAIVLPAAMVLFGREKNPVVTAFAFHWPTRLAN
jgi:hypothetical protein